MSIGKRNKILAVALAAVMALSVMPALLLNPGGKAEAATMSGADKKYSIQGFAKKAKVDGGTVLEETDGNYYKVSTGKQFLDAIKEVKDKNGKPSVIELTDDIALGDKELDLANYSGIITAHENAPLTHPALKETGVSLLYIDGIKNLTIYSKEGCSIKHAALNIKNSSNLIIRNIKFDELWEWDDKSSGKYDENDWDYMTIQKSAGIWIDHCTFYKAYDGIIDIKDPTSETNVTISWCEFLPGSEGDVFFDQMMNAMKENPSQYSYYQKLKNDGMSDADIRWYAYGQKKTHLFGQSDTKDSTDIKVTLAYNYYKNSMDRLPRVRFGTAHVVNCVMDSQGLIDSGVSLTSNGAISACNAKVFLDQCYISGIKKPLISGNAKSPRGSIGFSDSLYYMNGKEETLKVINNTEEGSADYGKDPLVITKEDFVAGLGYEIAAADMFAASDLNKQVVPYTGAGKIQLTAKEWESTSYSGSSEPEDETGTSASEESTGEVTTKAIELNASDMEAKEYTEAVTVGDFQVLAAADATVKVDANNKKVDGVTYTQRIKLSGKGSTSARSIKFTTAGASTVKVIMCSSSNKDTDKRTVVLLDESGNAVCTQEEVDGAQVIAYTFNVAEAGTYYLASKAGGLNVYYMSVTPTQGAQDPSQGTQGPSEGTQDPTQGTQDPSQGAQDPTEGTQAPTQGAVSDKLDKLPPVTEIGASTQKADEAIKVLEEIKKSDDKVTVGDLEDYDEIVKAVAKAYNTEISVKVDDSAVATGLLNAIDLKDIQDPNVKSVTIGLDVKNESASKKDDMQQKVADVANADLHVSEVFDITVNVDKGNGGTNIEQLDMPIRIELKTKKMSPQTNEKVVLYTIHNGGAPKAVECSYSEDSDNGYVTFDADQFSYYIVAKVSNAADAQPGTQGANSGSDSVQTADPSHVLLFMVMALTASFIVVVLSYSKRRKEG